MTRGEYRDICYDLYLRSLSDSKGHPLTAVVLSASFSGFWMVSFTDDWVDAESLAYTGYINAVAYMSLAISITLATWSVWPRRYQRVKPLTEWDLWVDERTDDYIRHGYTEGEARDSTFAELDQLYREMNLAELHNRRVNDRRRIISYRALAFVSLALLVIVSKLLYAAVHSVP